MRRSLRSALNRLAAAAIASLLIGAAPAGPPPGAPRQLAIVGSITPRDAATPPPQRRTAYLLAYFKDEDHALHFATSADGYVFTDVNGGRPVLSGRDIAEQHGIRDPYITRGPDGAFYLAMTDLHIRARQEGLRTTEWERPFAQYGWGNNRALIFMKSYDLIHWTHAIVHVGDLFAAARDNGVFWAPEMIWDPARGRMMVYFTTRRGNGTLHMVYSYADRAFTTLTAAPRDLFAFPRPGVASLDGDITRVGNTFHLFYAINEAPGQLRQAVSDRMTGSYRFDDAKVNPDPVDTEAPMVWRRHGTGAYVLMYDVFGAKPGEMGFSETTDFVHFRDLGRFNAPGSPMKATNFAQAKHGAVMAISPAEAARLHAWFAGWTPPIE